MPKQKRTYPGSVFVDKGKLYIKFKGKKTSTGLDPTKLGYARAEQMLEKMWLEYQDIGEISRQPRKKIADAFAEFINYKSAVAMGQTIRGYKCAYKAIISMNYYIEADRIDKDIQKYIQNTQHSKVTINDYLRDLQTFLNWCAKKKFMPRSAFSKDYKQKTPSEKENEPYSKAEIDALIGYFRAQKKDVELAIMIEFMYETGARTVDCLTLKREQITEDSIIWKNKKTKDSEKRPISQRAIQLLSELDPDKKRDKIFRWSHLSASRLVRRLNSAFEVIGIDKKGRAFQEFRVAFRMKLLNMNIPEQYIKWLMRHKNLKVTQDNYTYHDIKLIKKIIENAPDKMA